MLRLIDLSSNYLVTHLAMEKCLVKRPRINIGTSTGA